MKETGYNSVPVKDEFVLCKTVEEALSRLKKLYDQNVERFKI